MPSYHVLYEGEEIMVAKNYIAYNMSSALSAVLDSEKEDWKGRVVAVMIKKVAD